MVVICGGEAVKSAKHAKKSEMTTAAMAAQNPKTAATGAAALHVLANLLIVAANDSTESFARDVRILSSCWFGAFLVSDSFDPSCEQKQGYEERRGCKPAD